jgi:hypothetical protein
MKCCLFIFFLFASFSVYSQFNDSIANFPSKGIPVYYNKDGSSVKEVKFSRVTLPDSGIGITLNYATVLMRQDLHFGIPLDSIYFYAKNDTLLLYDFTKDTIAHQRNSNNIQYDIYWRAFKVLDKKQTEFLKTQEILSFKVATKFQQTQLSMPVHLRKEFQALFKN